MNKEKFIEFIDEIFKEKEIPEEIITYWNEFKNPKVINGSPLTKGGKHILMYLRTLPGDSFPIKTSQIAEALTITGRSVSGSIRKLVTDGYVEKITEEPVSYSLTDAGKNIPIE